jgi:protein O-GlcNAc transferase
MECCFAPLLAWPDQLDLPSFEAGGLERVAALIRLNQLRLAETDLLATWPHRSQNPEAHLASLALLATIRIQQASLAACEELLNQLQSLQPSGWLFRWLQAQLWMQQGQLQRLAALPDQYWRDEQQHPLLAIVHTAERLANQDLYKAECLLASSPNPLCLEALRLRAGLLQARGRLQEAFTLLHPLLQRAPESLLLYSQVFELVISARQIPYVVPIARQALLQHGEHPELLNNVAAVKLFQRQPGYARRSTLLLATWASLGRHQAGLPNQLCSYEQCGDADWLEHLHLAIWRQPLANPDLSGNLALHLASTQSARTPAHLTCFLAALERSPQQQQLRVATPHLSQRKHSAHSAQLTVAWISADFTPHPVSRFLKHFLEASKGTLRLRHQLVSLANHGTQSNLASFQAIPGIEVVDVSSLHGPARVSAIRSLQADVAIDLAGWTGGHFASGFLARLAPVQVNYLGYFASSGLPTMDFWLGDHELFPADPTEWHTEQLWRLPRPFIAWQPPAGLPEGCVDVVDAPHGEIRFGSFNNNRKLSDRTLALWAAILDRLPDARLVLKASAGDDQPTQELLSRRMRRHGLDPERVEWLALTPGCTEHLLQYRHMDIALDPLPNGGCTTTCEALWMGCPVITLAGSHYVSRMSTAVLRGAGLPAWVTSSEEQYVQLAVEQALELRQLRQNRAHWRITLASSPLGDAADLMANLEKAFSAMVQAHQGDHIAPKRSLSC